MRKLILRYSERASFVLVFGISIGTATAGDCFNDEMPLRTGETIPESLRITDADLMWLTRKLGLEPSTIALPIQPEPSAPAEGSLASRSSKHFITDGTPTPVGYRD